MTQYIDKADVVAEMKRRIDLYNKLADTCAELNFSNSLEASRLLAYQYENLLDFLDTLEVKEVNSTNAFIEKVKEYLYKQLNEGNMECGDIETFIEDFINYMKGE